MLGPWTVQSEIRQGQFPTKEVGSGMVATGSSQEASIRSQQDRDLQEEKAASQVANKGTGIKKVVGDNYNYSTSGADSAPVFEEANGHFKKGIPPFQKADLQLCSREYHPGWRKTTRALCPNRGRGRQNHFTQDQGK